MFLQERSWARTWAKERCQFVILKIKLMERKDATNEVPQGECFQPLEKYFFILLSLHKTLKYAKETF